MPRHHQRQVTVTAWIVGFRVAFQQHGIPRQFRLKQAYSVFLSFEKKDFPPPNKKVKLPYHTNIKVKVHAFYPPNEFNTCPTKMSMLKSNYPTYTQIIPLLSR